MSLNFPSATDGILWNDPLQHQETVRFLSVTSHALWLRVWPFSGVFWVVVWVLLSVFSIIIRHLLIAPVCNSKKLPHFLPYSSAFCSTDWGKIDTVRSLCLSPATVYYAVHGGSNFWVWGWILMCDHSNESYWVVLFCGTLFALKRWW